MTKQQDNDGEHNTSAPSDLENADAEWGNSKLKLVGGLEKICDFVIM
jgi:hypothetical protein